MTFLRALAETGGFVGRHLVAAIIVLLIVVAVADAGGDLTAPELDPAPEPVIGQPAPDLGPMLDLLEDLDVDKPVTLRPAELP